MKISKKFLFFDQNFVLKASKNSFQNYSNKKTILIKKNYVGNVMKRIMDLVDKN